MAIEANEPGEVAQGRGLPWFAVKDLAETLTANHILPAVARYKRAVAVRITVGTPILKSARRRPATPAGAGAACVAHGAATGGQPGGSAGTRRLARAGVAGAGAHHRGSPATRGRSVPAWRTPWRRAR